MTLASVLIRTCRTRTGAAGLLLLVAMSITAAAAIAFGSDPLDQNLRNRLVAPGVGHLLGTDQLGRDLLVRISYAFRASLGVAVSVALISGVMGAAIGLISGYLGGRPDAVVQRAIDALMALPLLVMALAVVAAAGPSPFGVTVALSLAFLPLSVRVARASALTLRSAGYVESARAMGASTTEVIRRHLLPNAAGPWVVILAAQAGGALLAEASLSFLGVGAHGAGSLGSMLGRDAQVYMHSSPWLVIWPGAALAILTMAFNLLGDGLTSALTPYRGGVVRQSR